MLPFANYQLFHGSHVSNVALNPLHFLHPTYFVISFLRASTRAEDATMEEATLLIGFSRHSICDSTLRYCIARCLPLNNNAVVKL